MLDNYIEHMDDREYTILSYSLREVNSKLVGWLVFKYIQSQMEIYENILEIFLLLCILAQKYNPAIFTCEMIQYTTMSRLAGSW